MSYLASMYNWYSYSVILNPLVLLDWSQGWLRLFYAVDLSSGLYRSIGTKKSARKLASSTLNLYLSVRTSLMCQNLNFLTLFNTPYLLKNFLEYLPDKTQFLSNNPSVSIIYARWSSSLSNDFEDFGSNKKSPTINSNSMQAKLHISAVKL